MYEYYMQIFNIFVVGIFFILIYGQARYNIKNCKVLKKKVLSLSGFISKKNVEEIIRIFYLIIMIMLLLIFLKITDNIYLMNIFPDKIYISLFLVILAIVALIQIMFVLTMIVYAVLKQNPMDSMKEIDWLAVDMTRFIYTGYIRTFFVAVFDTYIFFNILFNMFYLKLQLSLQISIIITIVIYSLSRSIMRKKVEKKVPMFLLGSSLGVNTILLINACDSLFIGILFMYICSIFLAFKNAKARI